MPTPDPFASGESICENRIELPFDFGGCKAGQEWARRQEAKSLAESEAKGKKAAAVEKKEQ